MQGQEAQTGELSEVVRMLQALVRIDTTNPPGHETAACEYLKGLFDKQGIENRIIESAPGRGNFFAWLPGASDEKPLMLMSHLDVVMADASEWAQPPFSGIIADGCVWGRGSLDCKGLAAVEAKILLDLHRDQVPLRRGIVFLSAADEEASANFGAGWLDKNHPELLDCFCCINEGAGHCAPFKGKNVYFCQTAEKGLAQLRLKTHGDTGHGSVPVDNNAVSKMALAITRINNWNPPPRSTPTTLATLDGLARIMGFPARILIRQVFNPLFSDFMLSLIPDREFRRFLKASIHDTLSPSVFHAGGKVNVIPSRAEAEVDARILPGQTPEEFRKRIEDYIDVDEIELMAGEIEATESPLDTELMRVITDSIAAFDSKSVIVPLMLPGATDSRFLRKRGIPAYGFQPWGPDFPLNQLMPTVHGIDERAPVQCLEFSLTALKDIVLRLCK